ncbi:MAG: PilN domain-containing protein [Phycisphaeraceae bacterium]|nr:PilN domain-containing protein [Phycisphaeraceae bacterium]
MTIRVNLLPTSVLAARSRRKAACGWAILCAVALICSGAWAIKCRSQVGDGGRELTRLLGERSRTVESFKQQISKSALALTGVQRELAVSEQIRSNPEWSRLISLLGRYVGDGAVVESCRLTQAALPTAARTATPPVGTPGAQPSARAQAAHPGYILSLSGAAKDQDRVSAIVLAMEESGLFTQTTLVHMRRRSLLRGEAIGFEIRAELASVVEVTP